MQMQMSSSSSSYASSHSSSALSSSSSSALSSSSSSASSSASFSSTTAADLKLGEHEDDVHLNIGHIVGESPFDCLFRTRLANITHLANDTHSLNGIHLANETHLVRDGQLPLTISLTFPPSRDCPNQFAELVAQRKIDESFFIKNYAPICPFFLLPNHLKTRQTLERIIEEVDRFFQVYGSEVNFTASETSWVGSSFMSTKCTFRLCVYRVKDEPGTYVIEAQRFGGDHFIFSNIYRGIKAIFTNMDDPVPHIEAASMSAPSEVAMSVSDDAFGDVSEGAFGYAFGDASGDASDQKLHLSEAQHWVNQHDLIKFPKALSESDMVFCNDLEDVPGPFYRAHCKRSCDEFMDNMSAKVVKNEVDDA